MAFKVILGAGTTTTPISGDNAFDSINSGGGSASDSVSNPGSASSSARWSNFSTNFQGMGPNDIQLIVGSFNWSAGGNASVSVNDDGTADAGGSATADFFGGNSGSDGFFRSFGVGITGPGPVSDSDSLFDGGSESAIFTPNNLSSITGARCEASQSCNASATFSGSSSADVSVGLDSIQIEVTLTDRRIIVAC